MTPMFVVYMGGTCGDVITAMIDWANSSFNQDLGTMILASDRQRLKKPAQFANDTEKDLYVSEVRTKYHSLPSHDIDYHVQRQHDFVGITVDSLDLALWAALRFKTAHRPHVWHEVQSATGITTVDQYAKLIIHYSSKIKSVAPKIIRLEDVLQGHAVSAIETMLRIKVNDVVKNKHYPFWLEQQK